MKKSPEEFAEKFASNRANQFTKIFEIEGMVTRSVGELTLELLKKHKVLTLEQFVEELTQRITLLEAQPLYEQEKEWHQLQAVLRTLKNL